MRLTKKMGSSDTSNPFVVLADETNPWIQQEALRKLAAYEDAEEHGRLVVLCRECAVPHNKWTGCPKLNGLVTPPDFYCGFGCKDKTEAMVEEGL